METTHHLVSAADPKETGRGGASALWFSEASAQKSTSGGALCTVLKRPGPQCGWGLEEDPEPGWANRDFGDRRAGGLTASCRRNGRVFVGPALAESSLDAGTRFFVRLLLLFRLLALSDMWPLRGFRSRSWWGTWGYPCRVRTPGVWWRVRYGTGIPIREKPAPPIALHPD